MRKKLYLIGAIVLYCILSVNAQWTGTNPLSTNNDIDISKNGGTLRLKNLNSNSLAPTFQIANAAGTQYLWMNYNNGDGNGHIGVNTASSGNVEIMTLRHNGNVGIGTTSPNKILDIAKNGGTMRLKNLNSNSLAPTFQIANAAGTQYLWMNYNNGDGNGHIGINTASSGNVESLTLRHNGSVGIGTTTTGSHKLAVEGTIGARGVKVEANGWSDFVFNTDYELKDLEEVESFINENNHLPDVPSENEVMENGINVGEMDATLLQKIEELTLYMIEQNKKTNKLIEEVQELKVENESLKNKINILEAQ